MSKIGVVNLPENDYSESVKKQQNSFTKLFIGRKTKIKKFLAIAMAG